MSITGRANLGRTTIRGIKNVNLRKSVGNFRMNIKGEAIIEVPYFKTENLLSGENILGRKAVRNALDEAFFSQVITGETFLHSTIGV